MRRFKFRYTGGLTGLLIMTLFAMTVVLIPAALVLLVSHIEMTETSTLPLGSMRPL